jgi:uncharacterized membrane protein YphA (DoxX/SURF4 family)
MQKMVISFLLGLGLLAGVYLIHLGLRDLFEFIGQDSAAPGDTVGVLHVYSTRQILFHMASIAQIMGGLLLIMGGGWAYRRFYSPPSPQNSLNKEVIL